MREHVTDDPRSAALDRMIRDRAKHWRLQSGLSLTDLAQRSGLTYARLYRLETGDGRLLARDLFALARGLRIPIDYFYDTLQQSPRDLTPMEQDSHDFLKLVHWLDSARIRHRISDLVRTIANNAANLTANRY
ncbi:MAG: helix-turn-helix domain-containing protein [Alphaproteobacteria bacterium]